MWLRLCDDDDDDDDDDDQTEGLRTRDMWDFFACLVNPGFFKFFGTRTPNPFTPKIPQLSTRKG